MLPAVLGAAAIIAVLEAAGGGNSHSSATTTQPNRSRQEPDKDAPDKYSDAYNQARQKPAIPSRPTARSNPAASTRARHPAAGASGHPARQPARSRQTTAPEAPRTGSSQPPDRDDPAVLLLVPDEFKGFINEALKIIEQCNFDGDFARNAHVITVGTEERCTSNIPGAQIQAYVQHPLNNVVQFCPCAMERSAVDIAYIFLHEWYHLEMMTTGQSSVGKGEEDGIQEEISADNFADQKLRANGFNPTIPPRTREDFA